MKELATELECLAMVEACKVYPYLLSITFIVHTDHCALQWRLSKYKLEDCLWSWILKMSEYTFTIHHEPGKKMVVLKNNENRCSLVVQEKYKDSSMGIVYYQIHKKKT